MKSTFFAIAFSVAGLAATAQTLDRFVVGSAGRERGTTATASVEYTVGDIAISTMTATSPGFPSATYMLTQGFHQGITTRAISRMATGDFQEIDDKALESQNQADALAGFQMKVYPNPTAGAVNIELTGTLKGTTRFVLTGINGQEIRSGELSDLNLMLDIANEKPGVYLLKVVNKESKLDRMFRVVKQ